MRLFLAVDLDDLTRDAVAAWMRRLVDRIGERNAREIKWVPPGNLHLTVHFFGHVEEARALEILSTLHATPLETMAFDLRIAGSGTFPTTGPARVIWLGTVDPTEGFAAVHRDVEARLATIGAAEPVDARELTPHLTLGRVRTPTGALGRVLRGVLSSAPKDFGQFPVRHLTLYESKLSPKGPTYQPLDRIPLASR